MKKLTKKQRHEIYKKAYDIVSDGTCGCCALFQQIYEYNDGFYKHYSKMSAIFPEYSLFSPSIKLKTVDRWFDELDFNEEVNQRQTAILFCIEMTK